MHTHFPCKILHGVDFQHLVHMSTTPAAGSEARRFVSLEKSPAPTQQQDFCEQTPIDEARDCHTTLVALKV